MEQRILNNLIEDAREVYADLPHMQRVVVTQGIHESGFLGKKGGSDLAIRYNNLFGMKSRLDAKGKPIGKFVMLPTWEDTNGAAPGGEEQIKAPFRVFADHAECFKAHRELMQKPRYTRVIAATNVKEAFDMLYKCGYATDPRYPSKLLQTYNAVVAKAFT